MFKSWGVFSNPFWFLIERNVDISTQHLMRAIRLFIAEGERGLCCAGEAGGTTCRWRREADFGYLPAI
jgi:hypothetical protein